jgi:hypothetical protein
VILVAAVGDTRVADGADVISVGDVQKEFAGRTLLIPQHLAYPR